MLLLVKVGAYFNYIYNMAKIYKNNREHLVIQLNAKEATKLNFGIPIVGLNNMCLCGTCNAECKPEDIYYVCGINEVLCKDCVEDYVDNMNHYVDDNSLKYEVSHFNAVSDKLNMDERAALTPNGKCIIYNRQDIDNIKPCYT